MLPYRIIDQTCLLTIPKMRLDATTSTPLRKEILDLIDHSKFTTLVLDFSQVDFIDSAGLISLLLIWKSLNKKEGELKIASSQTNVQQTIELAQLNRIFSLYPTMEEALPLPSN